MRKRIALTLIPAVIVALSAVFFASAATSSDAHIAADAQPGATAIEYAL
jgi:hypothetical protein